MCPMRHDHNNECDKHHYDHESNNTHHQYHYWNLCNNELDHHDNHTMH